MNHLPVVSMVGRRQPTPMLSTHSEANTCKLVKDEGRRRKKEFQFRLNTEMKEYSAVRDRFLQQFFRRETRMKIINALPKERNSDHLQSMRNPESRKHSPNQCNFHNIRQNANMSQLPRRMEGTSMKKKDSQDSYNLQLPATKRSTKITRIRTLAKEKSHLASSHELSREEFKDFLTKARQKLLSNSQFQRLPSN